MCTCTNRGTVLECLAIYVIAGNFIELNCWDVNYKYTYKKKAKTDESGQITNRETTKHRR
jgi:hypothetical protein